MSIQVQKTARVEFPIDIANVALRDARCAREHYLAKRFRLTRHLAALLAERAFDNGRAAR